MQKHIIVWKNRPEYKGLDEYWCGEAGKTSSHPENAVKFFHLSDAERALQSVPRILDKGHYPARVSSGWFGGVLRWVEYAQ